MSTVREECHAPPPRVIIYRSILLPPSETFIRQQAASLKHWRPVLFGEQLAKPGLDLSDLETVTLRAKKYGLEDFSYLAHRALGFAHAPSVRRFHAVGAQLIHIHFGTDAVDIWPHIRALDFPVLISLHGYDINISRDWWESRASGMRRKKYPFRLLQLATQDNVRFIAVSEAIRQRAIAFGLPAHKVTTHHIGIDTNLFTPPSTDTRRQDVLFVGRLVEKKGVEYLIRACASAFRNAPGSQLIIAGDGPLRETLRALAASLGVPTRFLGSVTQNEVRALMHAARVFCLPSVTASNGDAEGFGLVLLEAQACGVPVVTSARGGAQEGLIDGETGFSFAEKDVGALAGHLELLLNDDDLHARQSRSAAVFVRQSFDLMRCTGELETLYDRAIKATSNEPSTR